MVKNLPADLGDQGLIPSWERSLGEGNENPLQYSGLENSMGRRARWATVHGIIKIQTTEQLTLGGEQSSLGYELREGTGALGYN